VGPGRFLVDKQVERRKMAVRWRNMIWEEGASVGDEGPKIDRKNWEPGRRLAPAAPDPSRPWRNGEESSFLREAGEQRSREAGGKFRTGAMNEVPRIGRVRGIIATLFGREGEGKGGGTHETHKKDPGGEAAKGQSGRENNCSR